MKITIFLIQLVAILVFCRPFSDPLSAIQVEGPIVQAAASGTISHQVMWKMGRYVQVMDIWDIVNYSTIQVKNGIMSTVQ